jgi:hypothetical protein
MLMHLKISFVMRTPHALAAITPLRISKIDVLSRQPRRYKWL